MSLCYPFCASSVCPFCGARLAHADAVHAVPPPDPRRRCREADRDRDSRARARDAEAVRVMRSRDALDEVLVIERPRVHR